MIFQNSIVVYYCPFIAASLLDWKLDCAHKERFKILFFDKIIEFLKIPYALALSLSEN